MLAQALKLGGSAPKTKMPEGPGSNAGVGLIYPPPDIRGVIDKTAQFVAKCGEGFEQRVLREQNHTKFAFLLPNNPYRPYYEHKVKEFKTGVVEETKPEVPQAIIDQKAKEDEKKKKKEQLKALTMGEKKKKLVSSGQSISQTGNTSGLCSQHFSANKQFNGLIYSLIYGLSVYLVKPCEP